MAIRFSPHGRCLRRVVGWLQSDVNPGFTRKIDGWAQDESDQLLTFLYRHAMKPEFQARLKWRQGTLAMWDNRSTWHYALNDYHGQRRSMHRITVEGVPLT